MTTQRTLLATFAHPDDESFGSGGSLAQYARRGVKTALVCATRGEVGEISEPGLATPETLATVREAELRCSGDALGLSELIFLGYRDSGMAGTPENNDPRAFKQVPADQIIARLVGIIRRLQPQVVITFDPSGVYGHPDHIAIHKHTVDAFHAAGDQGRFPQQGAPWQPARLFYVVFPRALFRRMRERMVELDLDTGTFEQFEEDDIGWPDDQIDITVDVSAVVEAKWAGLQCHRTQFSADNPLQQLPEAEIKESMSREYFVLAWPNSKSGLLSADDLFAGL